MEGVAGNQMNQAEAKALSHLANRMATWKENLVDTSLPFDRSEWEKVSQAFESEKLSDWADAIEILAGWKHKSSGEVPLVTDVSESVLRALYTDRIEHCAENDSNIRMPWIMAENVRYVHAMTIIRFVNFVREMGTSVTESMQSSSGKQGLPQRIVSLRHAAAHDSALPSLTEYRKGIETCKDWLTERYWSRPLGSGVVSERETIVTQSVNSFTPTASDVETIHGCLMEFEKMRRKQIELASRRGGTKKKDSGMDSILRVNRSQMIRKPSLYMNVLLSEGHLPLNPIQRVSCKWNMEELSVSSLPPVVLQTIWSPLLKMMKKCNLFPALLDALVTRVSSGSWNRAVVLQLGAWTNLMIDAFCKQSESQFNWKKILKTMLETPERFDRSRLHRVMDVVHGLTRKQKDLLRQAVSLYIGNAEITLSDTIEDTGKLLTLEEALASGRLVQNFDSGEEISKNEDLILPVFDQSKRRWTRDASGTDWSRVPLGTLPPKKVARCKTKKMSNKKRKLNEQ